MFKIINALFVCLYLTGNLWKWEFRSSPSFFLTCVSLEKKQGEWRHSKLTAQTRGQGQEREDGNPNDIGLLQALLLSSSWINRAFWSIFQFQFHFNLLLPNYWNIIIHILPRNIYQLKRTYLNGFNKEQNRLLRESFNEVQLPLQYILDSPTHKSKEFWSQRSSPSTIPNRTKFVWSKLARSLTTIYLLNWRLISLFGCYGVILFSKIHKSEIKSMPQTVLYYNPKSNETNNFRLE